MLFFSFLLYFFYPTTTIIIVYLQVNIYIYKTIIIQSSIHVDLQLVYESAHSTNSQANIERERKKNIYLKFVRFDLISPLILFSFIIIVGLFSYNVMNYSNVVSRNNNLH